MLEEELIYALALQKAKGLGDIMAKKLISHCGSAKEILSEKPGLLKKIKGIGTHTIKYLFDSENLKAAETELKYIQEQHIQVHYFLDQNYPERLKYCVDGPILLFQEGNIQLANKHIISIVGTRNMTSYGRAFCEKLIEDLKVHNPVIVSGFAYGVDICAHKAAIKNKLQTIAVLAHGFGNMYPKVHEKYRLQVKEHGGFLTDFWHDEQLRREHFLKRNRIIAGVSEATIIIESAEKGGALVTADIANSYNRDVLAVPGRSSDYYSKGCNNLIKRNQAAILTGAKDLIEMLNWDVENNHPNPIQKQLFVELSGEEELVYYYLLDNGKQLLDLLSLACKLPIQKSSSILFGLEMKGLVKPLPGKLYEAI